jgi:tRNA-dihydrouridine synthase B
MKKLKLPNFTSKAFFAPMAGVSDPALRLICKELGAGLVVTEFVNVHAISAKANEIMEFVQFSEKERPISIQLFGSNLEKLEEAVKIVTKHFDIIDYNMGCPAPHVTKSMACSALLQEPELTRQIFKTLVTHSTVPVTVKIRAGITKPDKYLEIGKIAEEEGLAMITLHPRTVKQGYAGKSNWSLIKKLKESVGIAVCGNGDIETPEDAARMLSETGCDYVMIGRAAAKNPFLFAQVNEFLEKGTYRSVSDKGRLTTFFKYLNYASNYNIKLANIRMQAMNFSKGCKGSKGLRGQLLKVKSIDEIKMLFEEFKEKL